MGREEGRDNSCCPKQTLLSPPGGLLVWFEQQQDALRVQQQRQAQADHMWLHSHEHNHNNNDRSNVNNVITNDCIMIYGSYIVVVVVVVFVVVCYSRLHYQLFVLT